MEHRLSSDSTSADEADLRRVVLDSAYFGGMVGCGETYIPAFALAIGLGETATGIAATAPMLAGGVIQMLAPLAIRWVGSLRRWVVAGATLQALSFLPLVFAALSGSLSLFGLMAIVTLYWAAGYSTGPAWNTWMEHVVPAERRVRYFAGRSRVQQACTFVGLLIAGVLLHLGSAAGYVLETFAGLFGLAALLRLVSANYLRLTDRPRRRQKRQRESERRRSAGRQGRSSLRRESSPGHRPALSATRLIVFLVGMQVFVQISGPYFVPFMFKQLEFGYGTYVALISVAFVSKVLSLSFWGRVADSIGVLKVLWIGGVGLVPLSAFWIVSGNLWWLMFAQVASGIAWAAYELGFFLMFFESMPAERRTKLLTYFNFANTLAICVGAAIGGALLACTDCTPESYHRLFWVSSIGRLVCLGLLFGIVVPKHTVRAITLRILSIRPGAGSVCAPITASEDFVDDSDPGRN